MFLQTLTHLEEFFAQNRMSRTLQTLRLQLASKTTQQPSQQLLSLISAVPSNNSQPPQLPPNRITSKPELLAEGLLGKIAYSSKILDDQTVNDRIALLLQNQIFQKAVAKMFPSAATKLNNAKDQSYRDELQQTLAIHPSEGSPPRPHFETESPSGIEPCQDLTLLSHPSYVLQQLQNQNQALQDQYLDDNDLGYHEYEFIEKELMAKCSKLTQKYGYPECAVKKSVRAPPPSIKSKKSRKFQNDVVFPPSDDKIYPLQYNGTIYDSLKIKVVYDRQKTGYEESKDMDVSVGTKLLGRYEVMAVLGSGVFAKVVKVRDLHDGTVSCFKVVANNKDFFDQSLDQIKLLRLFKANYDPQAHFLLDFKEAVYYKQQLLLQTELLSDNLFVAYRKNPSYFSIPTIKQISIQILTALAALHSLNIVHSDLKPENILMKTYTPPVVKVVDMGNSCFIHDHLAQYVQSRSYRAPEVILGNTYDCKIDIWSVGCIVAELWTKNVLFYNISLAGMLARIQSILGAWPQWMIESGTKVSEYFSKQNLIFYMQDDLYHILVPKKTTLKNRIRTEDELFLQFIGSLLEVDPHKRPSAQQALAHPFLQ